MIHGSADQISRCAQELLFWQPRTALKEGLIRIIAYFEKLLSDNNVRDRLSVPRTALWTHCAPVDFSEFFDRREDREVRADVFNWICSVVARFAASRRSAQLTSADLCLDFLYRNPLLGGRCICLL